MYWLNKDAPIQYQWQPTFDTNDRQPFGAYAFDKILRDSWTKHYYHNYYSFYDLASVATEYPENDTDDDCDTNNDAATIQPDHNVLVIANRLRLSDDETIFLLKYVEKGGSVILAASDIDGLLGDTLNVLISSRIYPDVFDLSIKPEEEKVGFYVPENEQLSLTLPKWLVNNYFKTFEEDAANRNNSTYFDSIYRISTVSDGKTISLRYAIGEGNLILISNPLIFTNYGILNDSINPYIWKHLAYLTGKPLIRTEFYETGSQGGKSRSEFRVLLSYRAFRWAFYTTLISLLVFMIFTARRRQKIIPVIHPPANKMLAFVRSIAGLYLLKNNNADLLLKKQVYWAEELKRKYGIDIVNEKHDHGFYTRVAAKTRRPVAEIRRLLIDLEAIDGTTPVTDDQMLRLIAKMNEL
jgi:hypothetical protein